jgi:hypothetical protein
VSSPSAASPRWGLADAGRTVGRAAVDGTVAFAAIIAVGQLFAGIGFLLVGAYGVWSWAKVGLLTVLLSFRADVVATMRGAPVLSDAIVPTSAHVRFVPMLLTIGFLVLAAGVGRRAARVWSGRSPLGVAVLAAAGAAVPAALLAAIGATLVTLSFPALLELRLRVDGASAALWAALLAAAGAGTGAYLEAAPRRVFSSALRGGLIAYGWSLGLLAVGVFVVATLEPTATRAYVDGLRSLGAGGGVAFGYHVLALPAQSALLLAPAAGSCLEIVGEGSIVELCPWRLVGSGPAGELFLQEPLALSPWLWLLSVTTVVAAILGGGRAAAGTRVAGSRAVGLGAAVGLVFASLTLVGGWWVAPELLSVLDPARHISVHPAWIRTGFAALIWGVVGGAFGAWLAGRRYEEPGLPSPTSA